MDLNLEQCPWCGTEISRKQFEEIEAKIRLQEQQKMQAAETELRANFEKEKQSIEARMKTEATEQVAAATKKAASDVAVLKTSFEIEKQALEQRLQADAAAKVAPVRIELAEARKKITALELAKDEVINQARLEAAASVKARHTQELQDQRQILEGESSKKVSLVQETFRLEREEYQKKIEVLGTQLKKKNEEEIECATIDLMVELQAAFPDDEITSSNGNNEKIFHKVIYKGNCCGVILIDAKMRQSWQKNFAVNLHKEQVELTADYGILATTVFPKGKKELCVEENVIVTHPNGVPDLLLVLRKTLIKFHQQGLTVIDRSSKTNRLFEFISSAGYAQKRQEAASLTDEILDLDIEEAKQHEKIWKDRGTLATRLKRSLASLDTEIDGILEEDSRRKPTTASLSVLSADARQKKII